ncbi:MAG: cytochrome c biogenesis protein CcsA [Chloroflexi bacterium]|nr:cytochrome c biogenesis protein CcsA [Chloroflexota bacterium]
MVARRFSWTGLFGWLALIGIVEALFAALVYAPTEQSMGDVQRIFYFHVPSAWVAFLSFGVVFVGSIGYLWKRKRSLDILACSAAEIGVVFTTLVLITGPIWGKFAWGTWWTWDPRLTTTLILWLIYVSYLMLRGSIPEPSRRARVSAVLGIVGFVDVPIVYMAIRWWRTIHPLVFGNPDPNSGLDPIMLRAFMVSLTAFTFLFVYLLLQRLALEKSRDAVEELRQQYEFS